MKNKITILALSWRDIKAPKMGGAEIQTHEMLRRLDSEKYEIYHFSPMFEGASENETIDGVHYIRKGGNLSVIWYARKYYRMHAKEISFVIDQCNTHRFFTKFWVPKHKRIFYIHQLTREIWDINLSFPWNKLGKHLENWMLRLNRHDYTIALSKSTKQDLIDVGFEAEKIYTIPIGLSEEIIDFKKEYCQKEKEEDTFIYVGRYAKYKGMNVCIEALSKVKRDHPNAKLWICGKKNEEYVAKTLIPLCEELHLTIADETENPNADIVMWGFVSEEKKYELMSKSVALLFPSIREGWGIIVTEAAYMGTPSIVYDSPGARDAVDYGEAGYMCKENTSNEVARLMKLTLEDKDLYAAMQEKAFSYTEQLTWEENGIRVNQVMAEICGE